MKIKHFRFYHFDAGRFWVASSLSKPIDRPPLFLAVAV
jgi:hypothetical protein